MNSKYSLAVGGSEVHCSALHYLQHPDFPAPLSPPPCLGAALLELTDMALPGFTEAFLGF